MYPKAMTMPLPMVCDNLSIDFTGFDYDCKTLEECRELRYKIMPRTLYRVDSYHFNLQKTEIGYL